MSGCRYTGTQAISRHIADDKLREDIFKPFDFQRYIFTGQYLKLPIWYHPIFVRLKDKQSSITQCYWYIHKSYESVRYHNRIINNNRFVCVFNGIYRLSGISARLALGTLCGLYCHAGQKLGVCDSTGQPSSCARCNFLEKATSGCLDTSLIEVGNTGLLQCKLIWSANCWYVIILTPVGLE